MHFKSVLAHLKSKIFSVGQSWWLTFFHTSYLLKSHVRSGSVPDISKWKLILKPIIYESFSRTFCMQVSSIIYLRIFSNICFPQEFGETTCSKGCLKWAIFLWRPFVYLEVENKDDFNIGLSWWQKMLKSLLCPFCSGAVNLKSLRIIVLQELI